MTKSSTETGSAAASAAAATRADEPSTSSQRERRRRILDATLALAAKGGYEAVQMRAVAEKAEVAVGTLYRYFPSKVHLLVAGLAGRHIARLVIENDRAVGEERLLTDLGERIRTVKEGPDGALYVTTSNGSADKVLRVVPS